MPFYLIHTKECNAHIFICSKMFDTSAENGLETRRGKKNSNSCALSEDNSCVVYCRGQQKENIKSAVVVAHLFIQNILSYRIDNTQRNGKQSKRSQRALKTFQNSFFLCDEKHCQNKIYSNSSCLVHRKHVEIKVSPFLLTLGIHCLAPKIVSKL